MPTAERVGKSEALFREVNERIRELNGVFGGDPDDAVDFVCECSLEGCRDYVALTTREYERVRSHAARFLVAPGHVWHPENEHEVARTPRYWVVEKTGRAAEAAAEADASAPD